MLIYIYVCWIWYVAQTDSKTIAKLLVRVKVSSVFSGNVCWEIILSTEVLINLNIEWTPSLRPKANNETQGLINSSRSNIHMLRQTRSTLVYMMAWPLFGAKPLSELCSADSLPFGLLGNKISDIWIKIITISFKKTKKMSSLLWCRFCLDLDVLWHVKPTIYIYIYITCMYNIYVYILTFRLRSAILIRSDITLVCALHFICRQ